MFYYKWKNYVLFSKYEYDDLEPVSEATAKASPDRLYSLNRINAREARRSYLVSHPSMLFLKSEGLNLLERTTDQDPELPNFILNKINERKVTSVNTEYSNWKEALTLSTKSALKVNVVGLGDVGSTLVTGLRLLGGNIISQIGIFDLSKDKVLRHIYECNQILSPFSDKVYPEVVEVPMDNLFDCDMFVFCVTAGVPPLGSEKIDVRIAQFEANSKLISIYAKKAREVNFKGCFAVVSDPVDLLCKAALLSSNTNENGIYDFKGLSPDQIRGYGLGVMNARAAFYARESSTAPYYEKEGRAFGPHGEGLIIADSINNYNEELSLYLTQKAQNANIEIRNLGFKPYIAPALSSGSLSIIDTIKGNWHYSSTYMGGVFMGAKNRLTNGGIEIEQNTISPLLMKRLKSTYERLSDFI